MNAFKVLVFIVIVALVEIASSVTVSTPKMTWADVFKDRHESNDLKRQARSQFSSKKSFGLGQAFHSDLDHSQYSLQYIDGYGDGQYYNQDQSKESLLTTSHDLKYLTLKDGQGFSTDKTKGKPALSYIYTEAEQPVEHEFATEGYKFVTVPQKFEPQPFTASIHQSGQSDHHYLKLHNYDNNHEESYASKYKFGYRVSDPHTGAEFGHSEVSEGHVKKGQYHVLLPDGRLQNVKYWADPSGYHATVTYEGHGYHYPSYH